MEQMTTIIVDSVEEIGALLRAVKVGEAPLTMPIGGYPYRIKITKTMYDRVMTENPNLFLEQRVLDLQNSL